MCRTSFPGSPIPVLLKSTHQGFWFFVGVFFLVWFGFFYGVKDTVSTNELNNCCTANGQCFIWFILMELHLPSSCVRTTEVIPVADEEEGLFLPL